MSGSLWILIRNFLARLRAWWAGQFMDEPPPFQAEPEEETIYHILPHPETNQPLPHNEEYHAWRQPDAGQSAATTRGPEYRDGRRQ